MYAIAHVLAKKTFLFDTAHSLHAKFGAYGLRLTAYGARLGFRAQDFGSSACCLLYVRTVRPLDAESAPAAAECGEAGKKIAYQAVNPQRSRIATQLISKRQTEGRGQKYERYALYHKL